MRIRTIASCSLDRSTGNRTVESTLRYLNGNCSWRLTVKGGAAEDLEAGSSPERQLQGTDATNGLIWKCIVESSTELHAFFTVFGKSFQLHFSITSRPCHRCQ